MLHFLKALKSLSYQALNFRMTCYVVTEVTHLLQALDTKKATGPDGIAAVMLKEVATQIAPSIT